MQQTVRLTENLEKVRSHPATHGTKWELHTPVHTTLSYLFMLKLKHFYSSNGEWDNDFHPINVIIIEIKNILSKETQFLQEESVWKD